MSSPDVVVAEFRFARFLLSLFCTFSVVVVFYLTLLTCSVLHQDADIRAKVRASMSDIFGAEADTTMDHLRRGGR